MFAFVPESASPVMLTATLPLFVMVTFDVGLVVLMALFPKATGFGVGVAVEF